MLRFCFEQDILKKKLDDHFFHHPPILIGPIYFCYQAISDKLKSQEPVLSVIKDKSKQIAIEGSPSDKESVQRDTQVLSDKLDSLQQEAQTRAEQLNEIILDRDTFEHDMKRAVAFLKEKDKTVQPAEQLGIDIEQVEKTLKKLLAIKTEVVTMVEVSSI